MSKKRQCELNQVMTFFDHDGSGSVAVADFLKGVRGTMSNDRKALVGEAYGLLDEIGVCARLETTVIYDTIYAQVHSPTHAHAQTRTHACLNASASMHRYTSAHTCTYTHRRNHTHMYKQKDTHQARPTHPRAFKT